MIWHFLNLSSIYAYCTNLSVFSRWILGCKWNLYQPSSLSFLFSSLSLFPRPVHRSLHLDVIHSFPPSTQPIIKSFSCCCAKCHESVSHTPLHLSPASALLPFFCRDVTVRRPAPCHDDTAIYDQQQLIMQVFAWWPADKLRDHFTHSGQSFWIAAL